MKDSAGYGIRAGEGRSVLRTGFSSDTPRPSGHQQAPEIVHDIPDDAAQPEEEEAVVGTELRGNVPVPLSILVSASTPGMKYTGEVVRSTDFGIVRVRLNLQRPDNLINTSITVMCLMMGLALSFLAMVVCNPEVIRLDRGNDGLLTVCRCQ